MREAMESGAGCGSRRAAVTVRPVAKCG